MAKKIKKFRPKARLPKGFRDIAADEIRQTQAMIRKIGQVYEAYGFEPIETPAFEYTDALGKFLPDTDRPNAGVFSLQDEDEQWMSLRYDMTAPLARHVAENYQDIAKPYRRYTWGPVWRNEKPGPGRFRQFMQFDADTVGTDNIAADAEICMLAADTMEALGIERGQYRIKINNRKILDGLMEVIGVDLTEGSTRLTVLRSLDKLDKFAFDDVARLLGAGRKDESGDFTAGAGLSSRQIDDIRRFLKFADRCANAYYPDAYRLRDTSEVEVPYSDIRNGLEFLGSSKILSDGLAEIEGMHRLFSVAGYGPDRIVIDPSIVRGLDYYTGPVFEAELRFEARNEDG